MADEKLRDGALPDSALKILVDHASAVVTADKPETFTQLGELLWGAFNRGRRYEQLGGDAAAQAEYEKDKARNALAVFLARHRGYAGPVA